MKFEGTYSANENHRAARPANAATLQLPRSNHAQLTFASRLARHVFQILDAGFMAERSKRATVSSRLALQSVR